MEAQTPSNEETRQVSSNEIDYAKYVLYVRKGIPSCDSLVRLSSKCLDIIVQDVDKINGPKPAWLKGIPSLVELPDFKLLTGTAALKAMEAHVKLGVQGMPAGLGGGGRSCSAGASLTEDDDLSGGGGGGMGFGISISPDERYEDGPKDKNRGGASLEDMMRLRTSRTSSLQLP